MNTFRFPQQGSDSTTITLTREQGNELKDLIVKETRGRFSTYLVKVGFSPSNAHAILNGRKKLSVKALRKLLSGLEGWSVECRTEFVVQKNLGDPAQDVQSPNLEEELFLEELDMFQEEQLNGTDSTCTTKET